MNAIKQKIEAAREALHVLDDALIEVANLAKDLPKPADQSREEYFEKIYDTCLSFAESFRHQEDAIKESILAMSYDRIRELEAQNKKLAERMERIYFGLQTLVQKKINKGSVLLGVETDSLRADLRNGVSLATGEDCETLQNRIEAKAFEEAKK